MIWDINPVVHKATITRVFPCNYSEINLVWTQWRNRYRLVLRQLLEATQRFSKRHAFVVLDVKNKAVFTGGRLNI